MMPVVSWVSISPSAAMVKDVTGPSMVKAWQRLPNASSCGWKRASLSMSSVQRCKYCPSCPRGVSRTMAEALRAAGSNVWVISWRMRTRMEILAG
jgi:hypothetical protein